MEGGNYIQKNWQTFAWVAGLLFALGGGWAKFESQHQEIEALKKQAVVTNELHDKEIKEIKEQVYKEIEQRVDDIEEEEAREDGYEQALKDFKK